MSVPKDSILAFGTGGYVWHTDRPGYTSGSRCQVIAVSENGGEMLSRTLSSQGPCMDDTVPCYLPTDVNVWASVGNTPRLICRMATFNLLPPLPPQPSNGFQVLGKEKGGNGRIVRRIREGDTWLARQRTVAGHNIWRAERVADDTPFDPLPGEGRTLPKTDTWFTSILQKINKDTLPVIGGVAIIIIGSIILIRRRYGKGN